MSGLADRTAMLRRCLHVVWSIPLTDPNVAQVRSYTAFAVVYTLKRSIPAVPIPRGGYSGIFWVGYVPPGSPNLDPVLERICTQNDTPF